MILKSVVGLFMLVIAVPNVGMADAKKKVPLKSARASQAIAVEQPPSMATFVAFVCEGTNYDSKAAQKTYNVIRDGTLPIKDVTFGKKVVEYIEEQWSLNQPRDTWRCSKFDADNMQVYYKYGEYLNSKGYRAYLSDGPRNMDAVPSDKLRGF